MVDPLPPLFLSPLLASPRVGRYDCPDGSSQEAFTRSICHAYQHKTGLTIKGCPRDAATNANATGKRRMLGGLVAAA